MKGELSPLKRKDGLKEAAVVLGLLLAVTVVRSYYASVLALSADEAYYWQWSRHLAWGYFDHPPMIAYVIAAGTRIAGVNPLGVRLLSVIMAGGTAWMLYRMALGLKGPREAGLWALALSVFTPLFSAGAVLSTPDVPFVFFWTAAIWRIQRAVHRSRLRDWVGAGLLMGLGMLSKFPMTLLPVAIILGMLSTGKGRGLLLSPGPWLGALAGATLCVPYIVWSVLNGWQSVLYQLGHGLEKSSGGYGFMSFFLFIGGQVGVTGFFIFPIVLMALYHGMRGCFDREEPEDHRTMLALLTAPALLTLLVFGTASFFTKSGPNWPVAMYPTSFILAGQMISGWKRKGRSFALAAVSLAALFSLYIQVEIIRPMVPYDPRGFFSKVQNRHEFALWAGEMRNSRGEEGRSALILADSYQLASLLAFYLPDHPETDSPEEKGSGSEYSSWRRGEPAWFFTRKGRTPGYFSRLEGVGTLTEARLGREVGTISAKFGRLKAYQPAER
jgi:4-amino-4-deoxy-L-arabinose transferase-like glycosyltransferase